MISILILTLNEERNIEGCLKSVDWCDDVVVLDSKSSDQTAEIARLRGCRVVERSFDNWSSHQNWANENIQFKHPWVFYLDADERMTSGLRTEIEAIAGGSGSGKVAYYCGRTNYFMGRWIKHCYPPAYLMRFFKPEMVRFERLVNPTPIVHGESGYLVERFDHYNFSKGFSEWFDKHNRYSQWEAAEGLKAMRSEVSGSSLWSRDPAERRKALKLLSFRIPFRPAIKFIYLYFFKFGVLDGYAGLVYCILQSMYEYQISLKIDEILRHEKGLSL